MAGAFAAEVTPVGPFWEAEPEHQDYLERIPWGYTCHFPRPNWKLPAGPARPADAPVERRRSAVEATDDPLADYWSRAIASAWCRCPTVS